MELQPQNLTQALQLCLSTNNFDREQGQNFLINAKKYANYATCLLQISSDRNLNLTKEIQQIAAVQLKNLIFKNWIEQVDKLQINYTVISSNEKQIIKSSILNIPPYLSNKTIEKLFLQIIGFILKYESEWKEFIPTVIHYLNSKDNVVFLCGVEIFYQMSRCYEFEIEFKREIYNNSFQLVSEFFEKYVMEYLNKLSVYFNAIDMSNENDFREMKILYKILKIFYRSIQITLPSNLILVTEKFNKWMDCFFFLTRLNFEQNLENKSSGSIARLNIIPNNVEELQILRKNILWKIKYAAFNIVYKIYEKYSDSTKIGKNEKNLKAFAGVIGQNYSEFFFEVFLQALSQSKEKYLHEEILCLVYQFFLLVLNRANSTNLTMLQLLERNLEKIVKDYLIFNNMLGPVEVELYSNNQADYIYRQFATGLELENKRVAIAKFLIKLTEFKLQKKSRPAYVDCVYSYLTNTLECIHAETKNNPENFYYTLLKESCINLMESLHHAIGDYFVDNIQEIIAKHIANDLMATGSNCAVYILRERSFGFIQKISTVISYKDIELIQHIVECTLTNIFTNFEDNINLAIAVKAALTVPALFHSHHVVKEMFKPHISNIFSIFLKLIQILDLEELIKCLEQLVGEYNEEVIEFSIELARELVNSLNKYIKDDLIEEEIHSEVNQVKTLGKNNYMKNNQGEDSDGDEYNNSQDFDCDSSSSSDEEAHTNSAFYFVLKTINKLILVASKREPFDIFYEIESIVHPVLAWGLKSNVSSISKEIIEIIYSIVNSNVPYISSLTWSLYEEILKTLLVYRENISSNINTNVIEPGTGYEHLPAIITIILNYIVKDPDNFLNQNGLRHIDATINIIPNLISVARKDTNDEVSCSYAIKVLIILLETYKEKLDYLLKDILSFVISELKKANQTVYKSILLQTIALSYVYNPGLTNQILEEMSVTSHLFELWVTLISQMKFDFEYRRSLMGFTSLLLINSQELSKVIRENIGFIMNKILFQCRKLNEIREKQKDRDEVEVSGDEDLDSDGVDERENQLKSKTKNFKWQMKDFIVDDLYGDDEEDEDYNELENSFENDQTKFRTNLDLQDEFLYLRDVMSFLSGSDPEYYSHLMMLMSEKDKEELGSYIYKAELRLAEKIK